MAVLATVIVCTVPFPFIGRPLAHVFGIPVWLLWSLGFTALLSAVTAWGVLRYWRDDRID